MALSATLVWECRASGASDNNGGGFKAGAAGTDRSKQNAAQVAIDNSTITTSITANVITFTGYVPTSADVGNVVQMLTGTNVTAGFYEITAQTATSWTVTGTAALPTSGTTTNATGNMGGALATLGKLVTALATVGGNIGWATGAFTATATSTFTSAAGSPTSTVPMTRIIGYGATRGDTTHATLTLQTNTGLTGLAMGSSTSLEQVDVDCGSLGTSTGISAGNFSQVRNCKVGNFTTIGISITSSQCLVWRCEVTGGTAAATAAINGTTGSAASGCFVHDNACPGIIATDNMQFFGNLVVNNSGASSDGIRFRSGCTILNNTCHNNGRHGLFHNGTDLYGNAFLNNLLTNNGGFGFVGSSGTALPADPRWDGNAYGGGASANTSGTRSLLDNVSGIFAIVPYTNVRDVILTASPYVGGTTGTTANFALNNTAGGGAACKAAGTPSTWPGNTGTTGYPDMGAVQSRAVATPFIIMATG